MSDRQMQNDNIECPLCLGQGQLTRAEVLERLGMKDFARIAQLSAEEAFRLLLKEHKDEENSLWLRFENELTKRLNDVTAKHKNETLALQTEKASLEVRLTEFQKNQDAALKNAKQSERLDAEEQLQDQIVTLNGKISDLEAKSKLFEQQKSVELSKLKNQLGAQITAKESEASDLDRKVKDYLKEIGDLRSKNQTLEMEMSKVARVGKKEEVSFAEEAQTWPGIWLSEKLKKYGDYLLAYRDASGEPLDPKMVVDNKDKNSVTEEDVEKLIRDAKEQEAPVAALVTRDDTQLRTLDKEGRWASKDGVWILRTTRQWFHRDLRGVVEL
jgi:chromosome segregation ATPase